MSTTAIRGKETTTDPRLGTVDMKLEVITIPVSDLDRAKEFYEGLGWRLDADFKDGSERAVQLTPPGSQCSIHLGKNAPGPAQGIFLIVSDIEAARDDLVRRGAEVSEVFHFTKPPFGGRVSGVAPGHISYGSYAGFKDPDGNGWVLQEVTTRLPGRVAGDTTYASVTDLSEALKRAEAAHGEHEKRIGVRDADWPSWYSEYMVKEQSGEELPL
ncbi:MAG TPA: VOC family protein [Gemmatimonadales bacterium]|jgi:catechol 2,3-dioxygenase-like lactoylglutathione lyase family enzyme